jgi:hypothetical protein
MKTPGLFGLKSTGVADCWGVPDAVWGIEAIAGN